MVTALTITYFSYKLPQALNITTTYYNSKHGCTLCCNVSPIHWLHWAKLSWKEKPSSESTLRRHWDLKLHAGVREKKQQNLSGQFVFSPFSRGHDYNWKAQQQRAVEATVVSLKSRESQKYRFCTCHLSENKDPHLCCRSQCFCSAELLLSSRGWRR